MTATKGTTEVEAKAKAKGLKKILTGSFLVVALVHIAVFTTIGALTGSWRLLAVFLVGFVITAAIIVLVKIATKNRPRE